MEPDFELSPAQIAGHDQTTAALRDGMSLPTKAATKEQIIDINDQSMFLNYNRVLEPEWLEDNVREDGWCVLKPIMKHFHAEGKPVAEHYRCMVYLPRVVGTEPVEAIIDVDPALFNDLVNAKDLLDAQEA